MGEYWVLAADIIVDVALMMCYISACRSIKELQEGKNLVVPESYYGAKL